MGHRTRRWPYFLGAQLKHAAVQLGLHPVLPVQRRRHPAAGVWGLPWPTPLVFRGNCCHQSGYRKQNPNQIVFFLETKILFQCVCVLTLPSKRTIENYTLLSRVRNKPYDVFGCWLNETHLISGNLHWIGNMTSCSVLWLNKAFQVSVLINSEGV